ncbi:MAG: HAD family phosphatase [Clostridia bacterium]|nr:HAD family phosphatase [Clostridia bacterium]
MIKNLIFDFGNVLGQCYADCLTGAYVEDVNEKNLIRDTVFDRLYWDRLDRGAITDEEVIAGFCSRLPEELHEDARIVYENWVNTMTPVPGMSRLIRELKRKGYKLYLLSNISVGFAETYHTVPWIRSLFEHFDGLVLSGTIKMAKPDREIFEYVLDQFHLKAEECLFIDDVHKNLDGARLVGINGYHFDGDVSKLRNYIEQ